MFVNEAICLSTHSQNIFSILSRASFCSSSYFRMIPPPKAVVRKLRIILGVKNPFPVSVTVEKSAVKLSGFPVMFTWIFCRVPEVFPSAASILYPFFVLTSVGANWFSVKNCFMLSLSLSKSMLSWVHWSFIRISQVVLERSVA